MLVQARDQPPRPVQPGPRLRIAATDLHEQGKAAESRAEDPAALFTTQNVFERLLRHPSVTLSALASDSLETTCHLRVETVERLAGDLVALLEELSGETLPSEDS